MDEDARARSSKQAAFELYNFHVGHFSRFQIDFELGIQIGKGDNF